VKNFACWVLVGLMVACGSTGSNGGAAPDGGTPSSSSGGLGPSGGAGAGGLSSVAGAGEMSGANGAQSGGSGVQSGGSAGSGGAPPATDGGPTPVPVPTTDRTKIQLADGWKFMGSNTLTGAEAVAFDDTAWSAVSVPHTWDSVLANSNAIASFSNSWYRIHFTVSPADAQKRFYVYFEGAFQIADVFVNGKHLGQHRGGYTRFAFDATPAVAPGDNVLAVMVGNKDCPDCLPEGNARLMKGYGGIYRKAWLVRTNADHVATTDFGSNGIYVTPSAVSSASAAVSAKVMLTNDGANDATFTVKAVISDGVNPPVMTVQNDFVVKAASTVPATLTGMVMNPKLWSPNSPNLYDIVLTVTVGGTLTDAVGDRIGFRSYQLTASDFTLNGVSTRLRGMAKHQETEYHATGVTDADLIADWDNLKEMGANYVRLVHYPHAQLEYDMADQLGLMVWAENGHTNGNAGDPGTANGDQITREMIYQNWNHPSIIFWSCGNEAGGVTESTRYAGVIKATDPSRPAVYASNGQTPAGVDYIFHNTYAGWYGGTMYDFIKAGDHWVSETGAGMVIATHTADPFAMKFTVNSFEPEDYGELVDEVRFDDLSRNPSHVPAYSGWAFRDISDVKYKNRLNSKGLVTFAGYKKDAFYYFKSQFGAVPVVHLVGSTYFLRGGTGVKAYSNAATLTLTVNGTAVGSLSNNKYTHPNGTPIKDAFYWPNVLQTGKNVVSASDGAGTIDALTVYFLGTGPWPAEPAAKVANLTATPGPAYFIDAPVADQHPFYFDFDGTGDNTFDVVPAPAVGASWIATKRQSDATKRTDLAFDVPTGADVYVMFTKQGAAPAWVTGAGFADTGATGKWRDNSPALVEYALYKKTFAAGSHVSLATTAVDYVVLVK
jgi:beta-galactosidase